MKQDLDNNMELCAVLIEDFAKNMRDGFNRQATDKDFLNRKDYKTCFDRSSHAYDIATASGKKILGLAIAKENQDNHGVNTTEEQLSLMGDMTDEGIEASTQSAWRD